MLFYNVTAVAILLSDNESWAVIAKGRTGVQEFAVRFFRLVKSFSEMGQETELQGHT